MNMRKYTGRGVASSMALAMMLMASQASHAADNADAAAVSADRDDEAIIVTGLKDEGTGTGTKTATPLIETPQSITVVTSEELQRRGALSINQALGYVAGVAANQRGGSTLRYDLLSIRGFSPGFYLDGMRTLAGPYSTPQTDFNRIDQIDVVKGPASVLYGNSPPGGLVNLTSKVPQAEAAGRIEAQYGNYNSKRVTVDVNQPLDSAGKLRVRLLGGWQKQDGFTLLTEAERYHISPTLSFVPDDKTSLTVIGVYQHAPSSSGYSGVPAYGSVLANPFGPIVTHQNTGDPAYEIYNHKQRALSVLFRHDFDAHLTVRSNLRFHHNELVYRQIYTGGFATTGSIGGGTAQSDFSTLTRGGGGADENFNTLTMDNSLNAKFATGPIRHNILAGLDYLNIVGTAKQAFNSGQTTNLLTSIPNLSLYSPVYGGQMPAFDLTQLSSSYTLNYSRRDQVGLYIQDQITWAGLHLIASGRWDDYSQRTLNLRTNAVTTLAQKAFTMRLGALYEFAFGVSPYFSYSESFEPQSGSDYLGNLFSPITGRSYEAGLKFQPRGTNAIFTAAVYDLRRQNVAVADPLAGTGGRPTNSQVQAGETKTRGIELEARGEVMPGLDVIFAGTYMDSVITVGTPAVAARAPTATALGTTGTPTTTGTPVLGVPEWQASGFLSYDFGRGAAGETPLGGLSIGGGARYVAGAWGSTNYKVANSRTVFEMFKTEGFTLFDAMVGYDLGHASPMLRGMSLTVNAQNLFDKRHIASCPFSNSCYFGATRTVMGSLRYKW